MQKLIDMAIPKQCDLRVVELLTQKAAIKQEVFRKSKDYFNLLKKVVERESQIMGEAISEVKEDVRVEYKDNGPNECELHFSGDVLLFNMHTNVFTFDKTHRMWKTSYIKEDKRRSYFAMINIYNFLADSLKYGRGNDNGILMARIFINREGHFFVEGKRHLSFIFTQPGKQLLTEEHLKEVVDMAMVCSLEFDLTVPDYKNSMVVSVRQIQALSSELQLATSKKVGLGYYTRMQK